MLHERAFRTEARQQIRLAAPIVVLQIGLMAMSIVDTVLVGEISKEELAGVALGNTLSFLAVSFGMGVLLVLDPLISQAIGAEDEASLRRSLQRAAILSFGLTIPAALLLVPSELVLGLLGQPVATRGIAAGYAHMLLPGLPAFFLFITFRQTLQALGRLRAMVFVILFANGINYFLDRALIFGSYGLPAMGAEGCGIATSCSRWFVIAVLLALMRRELVTRLWPIDRDNLRLKALFGLFRLGLPSGGQLLIEGGAFNAMLFFMGWISTAAIGAHQVTLHYASLTFMLPLGIASAAAVRVGIGIGAGRMPAVRLSGKVAIFIAAASMLFAAAIFAVFPRYLATRIVEEASIVEIAVVLLPIAAAFQILDGLQVVATGILRGAGDVKVPMLFHLVGFWFFGVPAGLLLAFPLGQGPAGLWQGLAVALLVTASLLLLRVRRVLSQDLERMMLR